MIRLNRQNPVRTLPMILFIVNSAQCNPILYQYSNFFYDNIKADQLYLFEVCIFIVWFPFPKTKKKKKIWRVWTVHALSNRSPVAPFCCTCWRWSLVMTKKIDRGWNVTGSNVQHGWVAAYGVVRGCQCWFKRCLGVW